MKARRALLAIALAVGLGLTLLWILIVQAGTNEWTPTGPPGGPYYTDFQADYYRAKILAVAVDPNTPGTLYALAASPGNGGPTKIYKSTDRGDNWTVCYTATNQLNALAVNGTLVYAGGPYQGSCCAATGSSIFKSSDGGLQWTAVYTPPFKSEIPALAINPLTPTTVYAAGGERESDTWWGMVKGTTNGGLTWTDLLTKTDSNFYSLVINPLTPTIVYAGGDDGIYRSTDGVSFNKVYTGAGVYDLAINPLTPNTVYAGSSLSPSPTSKWTINPLTPNTVYAGAEGAPTAVLRSTDGGLNWTEVLTDPLQSHPFLAVDPPNTVYAMDESTVYRSTAGGDPGTWNPTAAGPNGWSPANDLTIELPSSHLYAAMGGQVDAGVYRSDDGGDSWSMKNNGLRVPVGIVDIAIDPQDPSILYATGFEPGGWKSTDSGVTWSFMSGTSYLWSFAINPLTPTTVLAGGSCDQCPTIYRSTDRGVQWTGVYTSPGVATSYGEVMALAIHPVTPSIAYAVEQNGDPLNNGRILRSTDGGLSWTAVYTENGLQLETVAASSALAGGRDANGAGAIYHSSDGTTNWTRVHTTSTGINSIAVHPVTPTIVLALGKHVYKSTDGGLIWTQITSQRVYGPKLAFNPLDANIVYGGGHSDPKISTDGGENWDLFRAGMPSGGWIQGIAVDRALGIQTIYIGYAGVWSYSQPSPLQVVVVTSAADSGPGTLRQALLDALSGDTITFDTGIFPPGNPQTITLSSALPDIITDNVTIDGSNAGVILDGSGTPEGTAGLVIDGASNVVIKGLQILNFPGDGIVLQNGASNNIIGGTNATPGGSCTGDCNLISGNGTGDSGAGVYIQGSDTMSNTVSGNYIGTDASGTLPLGNKWRGVLISGAQWNIIGGDTPGERNLISGNNPECMTDSALIIGYGAMNNTVKGNYIGTDVSGTSALPNCAAVDIRREASYNVISDNLISGNEGIGVTIRRDAMHNTISGNKIGTDVNGTSALPNGRGFWIAQGAQHNVIGGDTPGERNIISGNRTCGVCIGGGSDPSWDATMNNIVNGNYIGTDISGTSPIGNVESGVTIGRWAQDNVIGGDTPGERNLISGNGGEGVLITDTLAMSNTISGNYIGTNISGTAVISNTGNGISIGDGASYNVIGGTTAGERNIISGNGSGMGNAGVWIQDSGTMSNTVSGNYIGTDVNGTSALGNNWDGVWIGNGASNNIVGGVTAAERNVISGNDRVGVSINGDGSGTAENVVQGNYIGTDVNGTSPLGNGVADTYTGVEVYYSADNTIANNLISGNNGNGVVIQGDSSTGNVVRGSYIGTNISGTAAISNTHSGVQISDGASYNVIGGDAAGERNLISGNGMHGVLIYGSGTMSNTVGGNYIGTDINGTAAISNTYAGVWIDDGPQYNVIGGNNATPGDSCTGDCNLISGNGNIGVSLSGSATMSNTVSGNYIGTDVSGTAALGNVSNGVFIVDGAQRNVIGGTTAGERNIISGSSTNQGIHIMGGHRNTVIGNYIGTDVSGTAAIGNTRGVGIDYGAQYNVIGGNTAGERNLISGNSGDGVSINDSGTMSNTVSGNYIGTDVSGTAAIPNNNHGVEIREGVQYSVIGGDTPGERNLISGNGMHGVYIHDSGTMSNTVKGNYIGTDVSGTAAISNTENGVWITDGASYNVIGGSNASPGGFCTGDCNLISGNGNEGVSIEGGDTMSNTVSGNYIGTDASGTMVLGNIQRGVVISGAQWNIIGGDTPGERNLISGNNPGCVFDSAMIIGYDGAMNNTVKGNYIGTDASGTSALPNCAAVDIRREASYNVISDNLISGNEGIGVTIRRDAMNNVIIGNKIGTDVNGTSALPNGRGFRIAEGAQYNVIGGDTPGERNIISGNRTCGVLIAHSNPSWGPTMNNTVSGNYIGTDISGTSPIGNVESGITIGRYAQYNIIGGATPGERNLISGNGGEGVLITDTLAMSNTISGNYIGTDTSGTAALGNQEDGILIESASDNVVGPDNTVAHNGGHGVGVSGSDALRNTITQNSIHGNARLGIELVDGGNAELAAPVITSYDLATGVVTGTTCANCTVEVFSDSTYQGEIYEGDTTADGAGDFTFSKGASLTGPHLTATATDGDGNTSEFSDPAPPVNTPPDLFDLPDQVFTHTTSLPATIDLWAYAWDAQSPVDVLTYTLEITPPIGAGVTLEDNRYVHVNPSADWCGGTDVTVRVTDPGGLWDTDTFLVAVTWSCLGPLPGAPALVAPPDGSTASSNTPTFAWDAVADAEEYQIQVDEDAGLSSPEIDEVTASTDYTPASGLGGGIYYWRVRASNSYGTGAWSPKQEFTVPTPSPLEFKLYLPAVIGGYR